MKKKLTAKTIETLKAGPKRYECRDTLLPGFCVRVNKQGRKSFALTYRYGGRQKRTTLGKFPVMSLAEARLKAREILSDIRAYEKSLMEVAHKKISIKEAADLFLKLYLKQHDRDWKGANNRLQRNLVDEYGGILCLCFLIIRNYLFCACPAQIVSFSSETVDW